MDPWGSFQNFMMDFKQLAANPSQFVMSRMGIPQNISNDPDAIIQHMMSNGKLSQSQYNVARHAASQIQSNPLFKQFFK